MKEKFNTGISTMQQTMLDQQESFRLTMLNLSEDRQRDHETIRSLQATLLTKTAPPPPQTISETNLSYSSTSPSLDIMHQTQLPSTDTNLPRTSTTIPRSNVVLPLASHQLPAPPNPPPHTHNIDTLAVIEAIAASRTAPDLHLPMFRGTEPLKWYADTLRLISACPYHKCITHEDGKDLDPTRASSYPHVDSSILQQLRKVLPKDTMALYRSATAPTSAVYILNTVKTMGSLPKTDDELDALLNAFMNIKRGSSENIVPYTTRVQKSASLLRGTKHSHSATDTDIKRRWRVGLGPDFDQINYAFDVLGITPKGWDMSQCLILLTAHALKVKPAPLPPVPQPPTTPTVPNTPDPTPVPASDPIIANSNRTPSSIPTHVGTVPLGDFKKSVRQDIGNYKFFLDPSLEQNKYISAFPTGCYYCRMRNHTAATCSFIAYMKTRARAEYDASQASTAVTSTPPDPAPPTVPVAPAPASDNPTNIEVIEYSNPSTHTLATNLLAKCAHTNHPFSTKSIRRMILDSGATMHMTGDASLFSSFIPFPAGHTYNVVLGDGTTHLPVSGIGTISLSLSPSTHIRLHDTILVPGLHDTLYSIKRHILSSGCTFHGENSIIDLSFPTFSIKALTDPEISVEYAPLHYSSPQSTMLFDSTPPATPLICPPPLPPSSSPANSSIKICPIPTTITINTPTPRISYPHPPTYYSSISTTSTTSIPTTIPRIHYRPTPTSSSSDSCLSASLSVSTSSSSASTINTSVTPSSIPPLYSGSTSSSSSSSASTTNTSVTSSSTPPLYLGSTTSSSSSRPSIHNATTIKRTGSSHTRPLPPPLCLKRYAYATSILASDALPPVRSNAPPPPPSSVPQSPPPFSALCRSIQIPCLEEMLHEISVCSDTSPLPPDDIPPHQPTPVPIEPGTDPPSHLAYTSYHPDNLDAILHTPHNSIPDMVTRVPEDTVPLIRPADRPSSTEPQMKSFTVDLFQKCVGFQNIRTILDSKHLAQPNISFPNLGRDPVRDFGEVATLPKRRRNKTTSAPPALFGDVFHYDIVYGANTAIGGYRYALFLVDVKTRHLFEYPLRDISGSSLKHAMSAFTKDIGGKPRRMLADRDFRLIGGAVADFLETDDPADPNHIQSHVAGAPAGRQNQNGLAEIRWKNILNMVRN